MNKYSAFSSNDFVNSQMSRMGFDTEGEPLSGVRLDASKAYDHISELLQHYINNSDEIAWKKISDKIDYIYSNLDIALSGLDKETNFGEEVKRQVAVGRKLLFKPNLLAPNSIDETSHCAGVGCVYSTQWPFAAAVIRWFHDRLQIYYHQMSVGEASPYMITLSDQYSQAAGRNITPEAVMEGRSGDFYGGWGFYFVRKYLSGYQQPYSSDDPMRGYEDSVNGNYLSPKNAGDRLMVYDLNSVQKDFTRGRTIPVPDGINFNEITIHKAIIGGDPDNYDDISEYPGCILINLPLLKMHAQDLITNSIKNLGIGLYPMKSAKGKGEDNTHWKYAFPNTESANLKAKLPHSRWVIHLDNDTLLPQKDEDGEVMIDRTEGFSGTQSDIIRAVQSQNIPMIHITDAIHVLNLSHDPGAKAEIIPEGYIWASLDCVALDLFCARYCFKTLPMAEATQLQKEFNWNTEFVRHVPIPFINGKNISTQIGLDSPLFLYNLYRYAQERGVGQQKYFVIGWDTLNEAPLMSINGHLGSLQDGKFKEMMTKTMYYNPWTILHDLQKTMLSYAIACDTLTGSKVYNELMDTFDENCDGIIDYDEKAMGFETAQLCVMSYIAGLNRNPYGILKGNFLHLAYFAKYGDSSYNLPGYDYMKGKIMISKLDYAYKLSQSPEIKPDLFVEGMYYGRGNWPSWNTVHYLLTIESLYGTQSMENISLGSEYGNAFQYADKVQNYGRYTGSVDQNTSDPDALQKYFKAIALGENPLNFTFYVPTGYGSLNGSAVPNVEETYNPEKIFTIHFKEIW